MNTHFFSEEEAKKDINGTITKEAPINVVNVEKISEQTKEILEYIIKNKKIENENFLLFKKHLENKFSDYATEYTHTFEMICDKKNRKENVKLLYEMFESLNKVNNGKSDLQMEEDKFYEQKNEQYIYPKFGGKQNYNKVMTNKK
jgi:hypothetical protein